MFSSFYSEEICLQKFHCGFSFFSDLYVESEGKLS